MTPEQRSTRVADLFESLAERDRLPGHLAYQALLAYANALNDMTPAGRAVFAEIVRLSVADERPTLRVVK